MTDAAKPRKATSKRSPTRAQLAQIGDNLDEERAALEARKAKPVLEAGESKQAYHGRRAAWLAERAKG